MDSLIPFNIRNLLLNHHLEVASDSPWEDLICTLCGKLSMNAYQTFCGCTFCRRCIYRRLQGIDEMCPGGKADCQLEGLVFDRNVTRNGNLILRISRLKVVCPHESCRVVMEVSQMTAHMKVCPERPTDCPFAVLGCTSFERVSSERMKTHILEEAVAHSQMMIVRFGEIHKCTNEDPKQKIKRAEGQKNDRIYERREMNEDHIQVAGWDPGLQSKMAEAIKALTDMMDADRKESRKTRYEMETLKRESKEMKVEVEAVKRKIKEERSEAIKTKNEVEAVKRKIEEEIADVTKMKDEVKILKADIVIKADEQKNTKIEVEAVKRKIEEERADVTKMKDEVKILKADVVIKADVSKKIKAEMEDLKRKIEDVRSEAMKTKNEIEILKADVVIKADEQKDMKADMKAVKKKIEEERVDARKMKEEVVGIIDERVGELTKTVNSLSKWIDKGDAVGSLWFKVDGFDELKKNGGIIFSPYLYTHINGYKLRIQVDASSLLGVFLNVSSVICKGEYDDVLSWPAMGLSVSVNIINHHTKEAYMTGTIKYDNHKCYRPIDKYNEPYYGILRVSLSNLTSAHGIIASDSLLFHVTVSSP